MINYNGDLNTPPDQAKGAKKTNFVGKRIKGKGKKREDIQSKPDARARIIRAFIQNHMSGPESL